MKRNTYLLLNGILVIILVLSVINLFNRKTANPKNIQRFSIIDKSLTKINENISKMAKDENWNELKSLKKAEDIQYTGYNNILKDIKTCYEEYDKENKSILTLKDEKKVSKKRLSEIRNEDCLSLFKKYSDYTFTKDKYMNNRLQGQIRLILDVKDLPKDYNFEELLIYKSNEIHSISNLTEWLKIEFNTYQ